jgi:hypothetical protein
MDDNPYQAPQEQDTRPPVRLPSPPTKRDDQPLLLQRGGIWYVFRWGTIWMSWPFAKLTVFRDHFAVNGTRFTAQNVLALERVTFLFSLGLRIVHSNSGTSSGEIVFWSFNFPLLQASLAQAGFSIVG